MDGFDCSLMGMGTENTPPPKPPFLGKGGHFLRAFLLGVGGWGEREGWDGMGWEIRDA